MRLSAPVTLVCECSTEFRSADGHIPAGWTTRHGKCWCADCTRAGIPVRQLLHGGTRQRRRAA
ncbi:hypothetical protein [Novosphingobium sp.]|uniref:hypothetical protein n=1 Tax=Novosphingobium sp. TaxID=1874826 RepID=UPI002FDD9620